MNEPHDLPVPEPDTAPAEDQLAFDVAAAEALADRCWPALRVLALYDCEFEGGGKALARARFPALRHLGVSAEIWWCRSSSFLTSDGSSTKD